MIEKITLGAALAASQYGNINNFIGLNSTNVVKNSLAELKERIGITVTSLDVDAGEEQNLGEMGYGLYFVSCANTGFGSTYAIASFPVQSSLPDKFGDFAYNTESDVLFGRKETNGDFFVKNNSSSNKTVRIIRMWF